MEVSRRKWKLRRETIPRSAADAATARYIAVYAIDTVTDFGSPESLR
jgi:hypothetical protein